MRKYFRILIFVMLVATNSFAAEYYIDFSGGADTNSGTTSGTPFQHSPGDSACSDTCATITLVAGDKVYFKKGVSYIGQITQGQSGSEVDNGTNGAITSGGIFSSASQNFETTVAAGDYIYIYNTSTTGDWLRTVGVWKIASVDSDTQLTLSGFDGAAHAIAELPYRIWRMIEFTTKSDFGTGVATISGNSTYWWMIKPLSYTRFSNLSFSDTVWPTGFPGASCTFPGGSSASTAINNTNNINGLIVDTCTFTDVWGAVYVASAANSGFFVLKNNILGAGTNGVGALGLVASDYSLMDNNTVTNTTSGIRGAGKYSIVRNNTSYNNAHASSVYCGGHSDGIGPFFSKSSDVGGNQYGWIYNNLIFKTVEYIFLESDNGGTSYWTIANNVIIGCYNGDCAVGDAQILLDGAPYTTVVNNTIFGLNGSQGWASGVKFGDGTNSNNGTVKNNLFYCLSSNCPAVVVSAGSTTGFLAENNFYYIPNRASPFGWSGSAVSYADWKASQEGNDNSGSTCCSTDPVLTDVAGTDYTEIDLSLTVNSPATVRDAAQSLILAIDKRGIIRPQGSAWDIGAYEYQSDQTTWSQTGGYR